MRSVSIVWYGINGVVVDWKVFVNGSRFVYLEKCNSDITTKFIKIFFYEKTNIRLFINYRVFLLQ